MYKKKHKIKLSLCLLVPVFILPLLAARLYYLQVARSDSLSEIAAYQQEITVNIPPERGAIYDCNMRQLAASLKVYSVCANPRMVVKTEEVAERLAPLLSLDKKIVLKKLNRDRPFVWLKRKISEAELNEVRSLQIKGVYLLPERKRFYPKGKLASHLLGFCGLDDRGLEGLELYYDSYLKGVGGLRCTLQDAAGTEIAALESKFIPPVNGYDLILTIDEVMQYIAEKELRLAAKRWKIKGGTIIIMEPSSGDILALANYPTFDPNNFAGADPHSRRNRAVTDYFEPGSIFKIITASAGLEENLLTLDDKFYCEKGRYKMAGHILHDYRPHGWLSFKEVIVKSSNIGTVKIAQEILGEERLYNYIKLFGFGERTDVDLPGEVKGVIKPPANWSKTSIGAIPMGQEIGVTALQVACAVSTIANGGLLMRPRLVKEIRNNSSNDIIRRFKPQIVRRVITEKTAKQMKEILRGVVDEGTGRSAKLTGYTAAGKTGTAQKARLVGRGYSQKRFIASFIGFIPAEKPTIAMVVILDEPQPVHLGGVVCAPIFKKISGEILTYLGIEPDEAG